MMTFKKGAMASALVVTMLVSVVTLAGSHRDNHGSGHWDGQCVGNHFMGGHNGAPMGRHFLERLSKKLDLSEQQQEQIKEIITAATEEGKPLRDTMRENMDAERAGIQQRESERTLKALARKSADARIAMVIHGFEVEEQIELVLNDEQRQQLTELKAKRLARKQERMEKHREKMQSKGVNSR